VNPALWLLAPLAFLLLVGPRRRHNALALVAAATVEVIVATVLAIGGVDPGADALLTTDATARLFLLVIDWAFVGVVVYAWNRARVDATRPEASARRAYLGIAFLVAMNVVVVANHVLLAWLALEVTSLAAAPQITQASLPGSRGAAWRYLVFSIVGLGLASLGFWCLGHGGEHASMRFDVLARTPAPTDDPWRDLGFALLVLGLGTKLGLAPMYSWLPETYDEAPAAITAMLAAVQFNGTLVLLVRVLQIPGARDGVAGDALLVLGLASMAVSAGSILATRNVKRLVAYASINHAGVIAIGLGLGGEAAYGVLLYAVSNAFIKAILFLSIGHIEQHYQTKQMRDVGGLIKDLPYTGLFLMVGTFALLGFPPFGSFLGELLILSALAASGQMLVFAGFCTVIAATFIATGRSVFPMIWGEARIKATWHRQRLLPHLPKLVLLIALVMMGLYLPPSFNSLFRAVATSMGSR
jgi:hydrogenase-4 component F